jgi:hypothetical protein
MTIELFEIVLKAIEEVVECCEAPYFVTSSASSLVVDSFIQGSL